MVSNYDHGCDVADQLNRVGFPKHEGSRGSPVIETCSACTDAYFEHMPRAQKTCARAVPIGPRNLARNMCGGIKNVQRLCKFVRGCAPTLLAEYFGKGFQKWVCTIFAQFPEEMGTCQWDQVVWTEKVSTLTTLLVGMLTRQIAPTTR